MTQSDVDSWPVVDGRKVFPANSVFADGVKFGVNCEFGGGCEFGVDCEFGSFTAFKDFTYRDVKAKNHLSLTGAGSKKRTVNVFHTEDGKIFVEAGCFWGDSEAFIKKACEDSKQKGKTYSLLIDLAKSQWELT